MIYEQQTGTQDILDKHKLDYLDRIKKINLPIETTVGSNEIIFGKEVNTLIAELAITNPNELGDQVRSSLLVEIAALLAERVTRLLMTPHVANDNNQYKFDMTKLASEQKIALTGLYLQLRDQAFQAAQKLKL